MSYGDICANVWMEYKAGKGAGEKRSTGGGKWNQNVKKKHRWKALANKKMTKTRHCYDCGEQGHLGTNCLNIWVITSTKMWVNTSTIHLGSWRRESRRSSRVLKCLMKVAAGVNFAEGGSPDGDEQSNMQMMNTKIGDPQFHKFAEDGDGEQHVKNLNHLVRRDATQWTWKKVTVVVDPCAAEKVMQRSMFLEIVVEETERSKSGKGFQGAGGEHIKNHGQQVMSVRTSEGVVRKSTWQVADVRRPLVSASHIMQASNDALHFFITRPTYQNDGERRSRC